MPSGGAMKTLAIDFETANEERRSACAIGLAWIENGEVVRKERRLIRPKEMRFNYHNVLVHGIRPEDVREAELCCLSTGSHSSSTTRAAFVQHR